MPRLALSLLGPFQVTLNGERVTQFGSDTARALLAYLALHPGLAHSRDTLAGLLWPEQPNVEALRNLRVALSRLRAAIEDRDAEAPLLNVERRAIELNGDADWRLDVGEMRAALAASKAHEHVQLEECDECAECLQQVASLYRGEFLAGFALDSAPFEEWMVVERESLHWQALEALDALTSYHQGRADYEAAIACARRQIELEPWRETAHRQWMRCLALSGHRGAALAQYAACREVLAEELGVEPEGETTALYLEIREGRLAVPVRQAEVLPAAAPPEPRQAPPAPVRVEDERRTVTVVEATVGGAAELLARLGSEEWATTMGRLLRALGGEVHRYGGDVDRYSETGLVACFGAMRAHEDDSERAVLAALSMRDALVAETRELATQEGVAEGLGLRVSVHTGEAVVAALAQDDGQRRGRAIGEAFAYAGELHAQTKSGQVRVSEATYRRVAPLFEWLEEDVGTEGLGLERVIRCPVAHKDLADKGRGIEGLSSPLVGRDSEFRALQRAIERLQAGFGGIVTLVGEAGIGKSRLVAEVRELPALKSTRLQWLEGRCLSYGEGVAYQLWLDLLRGWLDVAPDSSPPVVHDALRDWVSGLCPDRVDEIHPYLARLLSLPLDEQTESRLRVQPAESIKVDSHRAIETLIAHTAERQPLVIVCEDLHWADPTSVELMERLLPLTDRVPLLFLCVLRPQTEHSCWRIWEMAAREYRHRHTDLWLEALSADESAELVGNLLRVEDLPRNLRARILQHAEGNPFYVEEVLRSLINSGVIARDEVAGHWQAARDVSEIAIPDTLHGVLVARVDGLPVEAKRLLQLASVIGRIFAYRVLAAIAERSGLDDHLATLQRAQMIRERARLPERTYIFHHQLTLDAVYGGLLKRVRRVLHRRVAEVLEQLYSDRIEEQVGLLARHWDQGGDAGRAVTYLRRAGEQAAAQYANAEAVVYLSRALELVAENDLAERYALLLAREGAYNVQGIREAQGRDLATLEECARELQDDGRRAEVSVRRAHYAVMTTAYSAAIAAAQVAIRFAQAAQDKQSEATAHRHWGRAHRRLGEYDTAKLHFERALDLARAVSLPQEEAYCLRQLGLVSQPDYAKCMAYGDAALRLMRQIGDRRGEGMLLRDIAFIATYMGDYARARSYLEQSLRICRETGDRRDEAWAVGALGTLYCYQGYLLESRACYESALPFLHETDRLGEFSMLFWAVPVYMQLGDYAGAKGCLERALQTGVLPTSALAALGLVSHYLGDDQSAWEYCRQVLRIFRDPDEINVYGLIVLGHALVNIGHLAEAVNAYRQASMRVAWKQVDPIVLADRLVGLVRVCLAQANPEGARAHVEELLRLLEGTTLPRGTFEPFLVYWVCYHGLRANEDPRAHEILATAYGLLQDWAAKIDDEKWRQSFLENVPAHREIAAEYNRHYSSLSGEGPEN